MRRFQIALLFLLVWPQCPAQDTANIVIRLLNGKNGKPVRDKQVAIGLGKSGAIYRDADSRGEIVLDVPNVEPRELRVRPDDYFDCRFKHDQMGPGGLELKYSLDVVISKGIVGENLCGKITAAATPGVLTLFLRSRTFTEKWRL